MKATATERKYLGRSGDPELEVVSSAGSYLVDARGKRYVDFVMGWCVGNLGWDNPALERRARRFRGPDYIYPDYTYKGWRELARLLVSIAPGRITKCFRATGGSEAVELALQAAMIHTGRRGFVSLEDSYHGNTLGALSVGASEYREKVPNLLPHCYKVKPPLDDRALETIERRLARRDVAAFIMEPIGINLGVLIPEPGFMPEVQRLCRRSETLLIMDEVACGFGRTGTVFASEQLDVSPDILCIAKAITSGVGPMGAMMCTATVAKSFEERGTFYSTYGWHPRSVDVAIATVRYMIDHERPLFDHVSRMSALFEQRLSRMEFAHGVELRVRGLAIGVDVKDEEYADQITEKCRRHGLLLTSEGSSLLLLPALNVERRVVQEGLDILERCR
jgi:acetylornithine/succinyldiaminopimelate/putrescine aminotransferase